jgi:hypothetical protein
VVIICTASFRIIYNTGTKTYTIVPGSKKSTYYYYSLSDSDITKVNNKLQERYKTQLSIDTSLAALFNKLTNTPGLLEKAGSKGL